MPSPAKGARLGGGAAHERLMLGNLATALFEHGKITTTHAKAKAHRLHPSNVVATMTAMPTPEDPIPHGSDTWLGLDRPAEDPKCMDAQSRSRPCKPSRRHNGHRHSPHATTHNNAGGRS